MTYVIVIGVAVAAVALVVFAPLARVVAALAQVWP